MALIAKSSVREVIERMDAIAVVGEYVRLEQKGGRWWGLCPFHQEKTGSFTVNPERKLYHCFGCGKGGSVVDFVMEMDKLKFPEAIEVLAKKAGVSLVYEQGDGGAAEDAKAEEREQLFDLYRRMAGSFHYFLMKKPEGNWAKCYIISRGISEETIKSFNLGYAPANRRWMYQFLKQKGYSEEFLASSGLFAAKHPGFPLFAGRLMFPIADRQGRVTAFGGRILEGGPGEAAEGRSPPPKYINSPETEIYKKGQTLFAIDKAIPEIRRTKAVYLAEGYMDVLALHEAGITNAVAPLGTAFTEDQARLLRRWADRAFLVFDSDEAGQQAAVKGILTCRKSGLACAVVAPATLEFAAPPAPDSRLPIPDSRLPTPKDPADILKNFGKEALQNILKSTISDIEYLISRAKSLFDTSASEGKAKAAAFLFPYLESLDSEVSREACIEAVSAALGAAPQSVAADYRNRGRAKETVFRKEEMPRPKKTILLNDELFLLTVVSVNSQLYPEFRRAVPMNEIEDPAARELYIALEECFVNDESGMEALLLRISSQELRDFIILHGASEEFSINPEQMAADGIKSILQKRLERRSDEVVRKLRAIKTDASGSLAEELLVEKMTIDEELRRLKEEG